LVQRNTIEHISAPAIGGDRDTLATERSRHRSPTPWLGVREIIREDGFDNYRESA
jgi:hypothetical protein